MSVIDQQFLSLFNLYQWAMKNITDEQRPQAVRLYFEYACNEPTEFMRQVRKLAGVE